MRIAIENRNSKRLIGTLLSVLCLTGCWLTGGSVKAALVLVPVLLATTILRLEIDKQPILKAVYLAAFFLFPFFTFLLGQILQSVAIFTVPIGRILLNMSLQDNVIRGYAYASVFGGSTPNSEYEFLTGNTMAFLPYGSIAYQQFFSDTSYTLVSFLKGKGYHCIAMHPFSSNSWMRDTIYPMMGFDTALFLDDFPQENLIREYVSDQEMFEEIIRIHQQQDENTPLFLFGVTMQNHGGYTYEGPNYETTITLDGYSQAYPEAEQYLSLIHETDKAVEYLIKYFASIDRDVVIVFYGDHMPKVENAFYEELNGGTFDTLDEQMLKQMVPFFIWANFDIEEKEIPCSSINYLSTYVLDAAGIALPPYQQFLKETERLIPAINAYGYYSPEKQGFAALEEASGAEKEAIHAYEILQYNSMFDKENRSAHFFGN